MCHRSGFNKAHELRRLTRREIEAFLADPHKRNADLRAAYELALDPTSWNEEQDSNVRKAEEEGDEEEEEQDMLEDEGAGEEEEDEAATRKRKAPAPKAPAKKPKVETPKAKKPPTSASSVPRKSEGADEQEADEAESAFERELRTCPHPSHSPDDSTDLVFLSGHPLLLTVDPETKKVKSWRHALQRGFLNKENVINADVSIGSAGRDVCMRLTDHVLPDRKWTTTTRSSSKWRSTQVSLQLNCGLPRSGRS